MNVVDAISRAAFATSSKVCLHFDGSTFTYARAMDRISHVAAALQQRGVGRGDRVALLLPNVPAFVFAYLGTLHRGAVAVSLNPSLTTEELRFALDDCGAAIVFCTQSHAGKIPAGFAGETIVVDNVLAGDIGTGVADVQPAVMDPDDPAVIVYSSGTTGRPKGIVLSHGSVAFTAQAKTRYMGVTPEDRLLLFLPLYHCFGQNAVLNAAFDAGASVVLHRGFDRDMILHSIVQDSVTMVFGVPTTFLALYDHAAPATIPSVRYFFSAAASLPLELERRWHEKFGQPIYQGYGLTESSPFATYNHETVLKPGTVGTPIDGVEIRIVEPTTGEDVSAGTPGEIVMRGPNVMRGYWNRPEETAAAIRNGWLHTGDIGRMDEDGYVRVEDRLKDMIIVGGLNVYPAEVENVVYRHPDVAEAAVFGVADPFLGEEVWAFVVPKAGRTVGEEAIVDLCRTQLAAYKVPTHVEQVESLPKNPTGKILKRVLREAAAAQATSVEEAAGGSFVDLRLWLTEWLSRHLAMRPDEIAADRPFAEYGLDSIRGVSLARDLGKHLGEPLDPTTVWQFPTVEALLAHVALRAGTKPARLPSEVE